jgi:hypothetical protein
MMKGELRSEVAEQNGLLVRAKANEILCILLGFGCN